jgi:hypothetical protein
MVGPDATSTGAGRFQNRRLAGIGAAAILSAFILIVLNEGSSIARTMVSGFLQALLYGLAVSGLTLVGIWAFLRIALSASGTVVAATAAAAFFAAGGIDGLTVRSQGSFLETLFFWPIGLYSWTSCNLLGICYAD